MCLSSLSGFALGAPNQSHHPHVLLHDLLRAGVNDRQTVESGETVLTHVLLEELFSQTVQFLLGVFEHLVSFLELKLEIRIGGGLLLPVPISLQEDEQTEFLHLLLPLKAKFSQGFQCRPQHIFTFSLLQQAEQLHQLQIILQHAVMRLVDTLILAPPYSIGQVSLADSLSQSHRFPEESRRIHLTLGLSPHSRALPLASPQVALHYHLLQHLQLLLLIHQSSKKTAQFVLLITSISGVRLLPIGTTTVSRTGHCIPIIVGALHPSDEIGELAVVMNEVLPDCLEWPQSQQFSVQLRDDLPSILTRLHCSFGLRVEVDETIHHPLQTMVYASQLLLLSAHLLRH